MQCSIVLICLRIMLIALTLLFSERSVFGLVIKYIISLLSLFFIRQSISVINYISYYLQSDIESDILSFIKSEFHQCDFNYCGKWDS